MMQVAAKKSNAVATGDGAAIASGRLPDAVLGDAGDAEGKDVRLCDARHEGYAPRRFQVRSCADHVQQVGLLGLVTDPGAINWPAQESEAATLAALLLPGGHNPERHLLAGWLR